MGSSQRIVNVLTVHDMFLFIRVLLIALPGISQQQYSIISPNFSYLKKMLATALLL